MKRGLEKRRANEMELTINSKIDSEIIKVDNIFVTCTQNPRRCSGSMALDLP